jgi:hypothetical protein
MKYGYSDPLPFYFVFRTLGNLQITEIFIRITEEMLSITEGIFQRSKRTFNEFYNSQGIELIINAFNH